MLALKSSVTKDVRKQSHFHAIFSLMTNIIAGFHSIIFFGMLVERNTELSETWMRANIPT